MKQRLYAASLFAAFLFIASVVGDDNAPKPGGKNAWTLEEAQGQLTLNPRDPYLQYVALQLARRQNNVGPVAERIEQQISSGEQQAVRQGRRQQVDLFSIFTGALAVQESLQLDTMRGGARRPGPPRVAVKDKGGPEAKDAADPEAALKKRRQEIVTVASLNGPTIKSHPWQMMLAGKKPEVSRLSRCVPEDFYFAEFGSLNKLVQVMEESDLWGTHLFNQAAREARTQKVGDRLKNQLVIETNPLLRSFYDLVVEAAAVTGSDLFVREGSDITLLFRVKQPAVFRARMDGFLANAQKSRPDAKRSTGKFLDIDYVHLETSDRRINVFAADPDPNLHVRSNSKVAFERVLEAIAGKTAAGKEVRRLGDTLEFAYIRTLMPYRAKEEDGLVYLSDPFIRRMVGPQVKLTERRRMLCYNHLRMIGHASLLYRTEQGKLPDSLETLAKANCCPGKFNEGELTCPDGGKYSLSADGVTGICSHHGHANLLRPCCEMPVAKVNAEEADEYKAFLEEYNRYWRTYFDPIALRIQITPQRYRLETIVLPLIDNSIYSGLAMTLGGKPQPLDALPVPKRNIFTVAAQVRKKDLLRESGLEEVLSDEDAQPKGANARPTAWDHRSADNLRQIGKGLETYNDQIGYVPAAASVDKNGKPRLSWRVHLLPFIGQAQLYNEFRLDEPWDSDHNIKLIDRIPDTYQCQSPDPANRGKTTYLAPVGKGTMFPDDALRLRISADVPDGEARTLFIVDADASHAVIWTKPEDFKYDPNSPRLGFISQNRPWTPVLMVNGFPLFLRNTIDDQKLRALLTRAGKEDVELDAPDTIDALPPRDDAFGIPGLRKEDVAKLNLKEVLTKGIGDQVSLNVYDGQPLFDFNLPGFLGMMTGSFSGPGRINSNEALLVSFLISSLNSPVYIGIPVQDSKIVDRFLDGLDSLMATKAREREGGFIPIEFDFYRYRSAVDKEKTLRSFAIRFGPVKFRLFWGRIDNGLYIASKPFILEDLLAEESKPSARAQNAGSAAHAMIRIRPEHWHEVLPDYQRGWAENNREACLNNLGPLSNVARAFTASLGKIDDAKLAEVARRVRLQADRLHTVHFFCPEGGHYVLAADGKSMVCDLHGSLLSPHQPTVPSAKSPLGQLLKTFNGLTASLTFMEDGLHAVLEIDRR